MQAAYELVSDSSCLCCISVAVIITMSFRQRKSTQQSRRQVYIPLPTRKIVLSPNCPSRKPKWSSDVIATPQTAIPQAARKPYSTRTLPSTSTAQGPPAKPGLTALRITASQSGDTQGYQNESPRVRVRSSKKHWQPERLRCISSGVACQRSDFPVS